ncbi:hypothetical protein D8674_005980 [Pyrus ussuriensis x Pyrus communis]|uniref:RNase H type-1 domain-containing protein n=1 Tax=Pyrus ussuriensis x Pyrus communis TaxID=2448454 RepID=A0A5N5FTB3_9ROSA|nr:hypothetical protein D8674_005980 [Pyrus ussuriensis x Pyrus communis]
MNSLSKALAICWQIWNDRNASIFKNEKPFHYRSFTCAMNMVNNYFKENSGHAEKADAVAKDNLIKWKCPMSSHFKINFDGSVANFVVAGGFVVRSWENKHILAGAMNLGYVTINVVETLALREALIWARRRNLNHVIVEGDSKLVIDAVRSVADAISSVGLKRTELCIWDVCLPIEANMAFLFYCNGNGCVRGSSL